MASDDTARAAWGQEPGQGPKPALSPPWPVEPEVSPVAGGSPRFGTGQKIAILLAGGAAVIGVIVFTHLAPHHRKPDRNHQAEAGATGRPFAAPPIAPPIRPRPAVMPATLPMPARHAISPFAVPFGHGQESAAMKALDAPIFAYRGGATSVPVGLAATRQASASWGNAAGSVAGRGAAGDAAGGSGGTGGAGRGRSTLARDLTPSRFAHVDARLIAHPDFTLAAGTLIPCTLQTAIDSDLPGFVKCILPQSVRSMTGAITLLDRGTQVIGQIQQGLIQGQDRLFILWTRAVTPQDVAVDLASPAAGPLGRTGVSGAVDNHFFQRFGAAIMLSVIGGSLQAASNAAQTGSGNAYFQYLNTNTNQIANTALQSTIDIPPTLRKNQGDTISIFVARDLNFSRVYRLSLVTP